MPKQYCPACGSGTDYSLSAPKFCSNCGTTFASSVASLVPAPVRLAPPLVAEAARPKLAPYRDEDDDEPLTIDFKIPRKLDIEIELDRAIQRPSLGSIMQGSSDSVTVEKGKRLSKRVKEEKLNTFRQKLQTTERRGAGAGEEV